MPFVPPGAFRRASYTERFGSVADLALTGKKDEQVASRIPCKLMCGINYHILNGTIRCSNRRVIRINLWELFHGTISHLDRICSALH